LAKTLILVIRQRQELIRAGVARSRTLSAKSTTSRPSTTPASTVELAEGAVVNRPLLDSRAADKRRLPSASLVKLGV